MNFQALAAYVYNERARRAHIKGGGALSLTQQAIAIVAANGGAMFDPSIASTMTVGRDGTGGAPAADGVVGRIYDAAGSGLYLTPAADAARPALRQSGGLSSLDWDGVDDVMTASASIAVPAAHEIVAAVGDVTLPGGTSGGVLSLADIGADPQSAGTELAIYTGDAVTYRFRTRYPSIDTFSTGQVLTAITSSVLVLGQRKKAAADTRQRVNGTETTITTDTGALATPKNLRIGRHTEAEQYLSAQVHAIAYVPAGLSDVDYAILEAWAAEKGGVTL